MDFRVKINRLLKSEFNVLFPGRKNDSSKYDYGHTLIVAGSVPMSGAAVLCGLSALRTGTGLVTIATAEPIQPVVAGFVPEIMTLLLPATKSGTISNKAVRVVTRFIKTKKVDVIAIGPGLTTQPETVNFVRTLIKQVKEDYPIVLDADGINAIKKNTELLIKAKDIVITPHPGEFARLIGRTVSEIQTQRVEYVKSFTQRTGTVCVLKGSASVVSDGSNVYINSTGNPGMATAGTGDVLTGIIAGLLSQQVARRVNVISVKELKHLTFRTVRLAVNIHGLAGDLARDKCTEQSLLASDIITELPAVFKLFRKK